jgi:hypothetical protein
VPPGNHARLERLATSLEARSSPAYVWDSGRLAIQRKSSEVWMVLSAVKTEFAKYGEAIKGIRDKIDAAAREIDKVDTRPYGQKIETPARTEGYPQMA